VLVKHEKRRLLIEIKWYEKCVDRQARTEEISSGKSVTTAKHLAPSGGIALNGKNN
jgi:hypothetical protein